MAIDIRAAFTNEPPELDFIWPGFLAGTVGALVAPGATGKSYWALEAAMGIACSVAGGDVLGLKLKKTGRVVYLAAEDPEPALIRRVHAVGRHVDDEAAREAIADNLVLEPIMGRRFDVMNEQQLDRMVEKCADTRLIVLDTLSRVHSMDENSNGDMARLLSTLEYVAASTGASVLFLHHVSKGSVSGGQADQQQAARGASALVDNARWAAYVAKMTERESERLSANPVARQPIGNERRHFYVRFGISKQNYDEPQGDQWYERRVGGGGVLVPVELVDVPSSKQPKQKGNGGKAPRQGRGGGFSE